MRLKDKVALVTGVSPNIGGGIAEGLAREGAAIIAVDLRAENVDDSVRYLLSTGARAIGAACDVTDEGQAQSAIKTGLDAFGKIDILVNNAAFFNKKGVLNMPLDEWNKQIGVILTGAFLCTKYVSQSMIDRGVQNGSIINIISTAGHQGEPGNIAYSTAKCGLLNFTRSAAMELVKHGIRVNSLTPTATDPNESYERALSWGRDAQRPDATVAAMRPFVRGVPMQKLPKPSDYGKAAAFLASDDAAMITGADLRVDAGAVARYWAWTPGE